MPPAPRSLIHSLRSLVVGAAAAFAAIVAAIAPANATGWPQFHGGPSRVGVNPDERRLTRTNVHRLRIAWHHGTGSSTEGINSSPVVAGGVVYVGSDDGRVYAFRSRGGSQLWSSSTGGTVRSTPAVEGTRVFVGSSDGYLYAFRTDDGNRLWRQDLGGAVTSPPLVDKGTVYVGSRGGTFYALRADTGAVLWSYDTWAVWDGAAYHNGTVFVGSDQQELFAFDAGSGDLRWKATTHGRVRCTPAVSGGRVFVGSDQGRLYAFDESSGNQRWHATAVAPGDGVVRSAPAVAQGSVFVTTGETTTPMAGHALAFHVRNGNRIWRSSLADYSTSSPAFANGVLYLGSFDHRLYAFGSRSGRELWTSGWGTLGRGISGSPSVVGGKVFIGVRDGSLYAFGIRR
jgi:outer membrane protein assembly factor BamB